MPKNEVQTRRDEARKTRFLECLTISSNVAASAKSADIPLSTLYSWRENDPDFYDAWMTSLAKGYELLEMELLQRSREGVEKTIFFRGEIVATVREYDNRTALQLLAIHKELVAQTRAHQIENDQSGDILRERLDQKINDMRERMLARGAFDGDGMGQGSNLPVTQQLSE